MNHHGNDDQDSKYSTPYCDAIYFPKHSIETLNNTYHQEFLPSFYQEFLLKDIASADLRLIQECPDLFSWTDDGDYFLRPNLPKYKDSIHYREIPTRWQQHQKGLQLIAWWVHPILLPGFKQQDQTPSSNRLSNMRICDIEQCSGIPFLTSPLDLTPEHLSSLISLRAHVLKELEQVYGIKDHHKPILYFHTYNCRDYAALHLHVRVNYSPHPNEKPRTFPIDQVIEWLMSGQCFMDCMNEDHRKAYFLKNENPELMKYLAAIPGSVKRREANPFR